MVHKVNTDRVVALFTDLVSLDSVSFGERAVADVLRRELEALGFEVLEDDAGARYGSGTGNLYARLKGTDPERTPVILSAHMDTVVPGIGKKACIDHDKGIITSGGDTVLGADDVAGIVEILEGIRLAKQSGRYGDIEVLFTVAEEVYGKGSKVLDYSRLQAETAFVVDMSGPVGKAARSAPSIIAFEFEITGRSAHSGFAPQDGINAIAAAAAIIADTRQGLLEQGLTLNIGTIEGGSASNIVPDLCRCTGEVRGGDHDAACLAVKQLAERIDEKCAAAGAKYTFSSEVMIRAYETAVTDRSCTAFQNACVNQGLAGELVATRGGSDNNIFAEHDIKGIVISCGMENTHTVNEYIPVTELEKGSGLIAEILRII